MIIRILAAAVLAAGCATRADIDVVGKATAAIDACVAKQAGADVFSGVIAITEHGKQVYSAVRGQAAAGKANVLETPFNIGSLNKMFTAVAIGQLVDQRKVSFDDPISNYLRGLPDAVGRITLAQLLAHRSGLGDYFHPNNRAAMEAARTARDLLPLALADGLAFEPGSKQAYSNSGYVVLGAVIEAVSGMTYDAYFSQHIFIPSGMVSTRLDGAGERAQPFTRHVMGSEALAETWRPAPAIGPKRGSPAGGAISSAPDLVRFGEALLDGKLVSRGVRDRLWTPAEPLRPAADGFGISGYGYGFNIFEAGSDRVVGHGGGSLGVNAQLDLYAARDRVVVALSNYDPPSATTIIAATRRAFLAPGDLSSMCASAG